MILTNGNKASIEIISNDGSKYYKSWYAKGNIHIVKNYNQIGEEYGKHVIYNEDGSIKNGEYYIWNGSITMYDAIKLGFWKPNTTERWEFERIEKEKKLEAERILTEKRLFLESVIKNNKENITKLDKDIERYQLSKNDIFAQTKYELEQRVELLYQQYVGRVNDEISKWNTLPKSKKKKWSKKYGTPYIVAFGEDILYRELFYFKKRSKQVKNSEDLQKYIGFLQRLIMSQEKTLNDWAIPSDPEKKSKSKSTLKGQVIDRTGVPVRGVEITLHMISSKKNSKPVKYVTKFDGKFLFEKRAQGAYWIEIKSDYLFRNKEFVILNNDVDLGSFKLIEQELDNESNFLLMTGLNCFVDQHQFHLHQPSLNWNHFQIGISFVQQDHLVQIEPIKSLGTLCLTMLE